LDAPKLCGSDSVKLHNDIEDNGLNHCDIEVAYIHANKMLNRWRKEIHKVVSEGDTDSYMPLPSPPTELEKSGNEASTFQENQNNNNNNNINSLTIDG